MTDEERAERRHRMFEAAVDAMLGAEDFVLITFEPVKTRPGAYRFELYASAENIIGATWRGSVSVAESTDDALRIIGAIT